MISLTNISKQGKKYDLMFYVHKFTIADIEMQYQLYQAFISNLCYINSVLIIR